MLEGQQYEDITTAQIRLHQAKTELEAAIHAAKTSGATWKEIGRMFGVSKQAAQKRFGND